MCTATDLACEAEAALASTPLVDAETGKSEPLGGGTDDGTDAADAAGDDAAGDDADGGTAVVWALWRSLLLHRLAALSS